MTSTPTPEPTHDEPPQDPEEQPGVDPDWPQVPGPTPSPQRS